MRGLSPILARTFVPMGTIITDPAEGFGGRLGQIFIKPNVTPEGRPSRPDIWMLGGFATDNGTPGQRRLKALAWGPDEPIIYCQFGSAWFQP